MYFRDKNGVVIEGYNNTQNGNVSNNFWSTKNIVLVIIISVILIYLIYYCISCMLMKNK